MVFVCRGEKREPRTLRGAAVGTFAFVMHGFAFGNHNQTLGARRGTVRSRRASRSGIAELGPRRPKPVRNAFIRPHRIGRTTHPSPARSHTSGTGIHPMEKPQCRREKPRPSYYPQSGGLDETHYQLHQDHQASRQTRLALHATLQVQRSRQIVTSLEGAPSCGATIVCCGMSAGGVGGAPDRASCRTSYRTT